MEEGSTTTQRVTFSVAQGLKDFKGNQLPGGRRACVAMIFRSQSRGLHCGMSFDEFPPDVELLFIKRAERYVL